MTAGLSKFDTGYYYVWRRSMMPPGEKEYLSVIYAFVLAMEAKDPYIKGHSERVAQYAVEISKHLDLDEKEIKIIYYAALVHDIGKIGTPEEILNKPGRLSLQERLIIQLHPARGAELLEGIKFMAEGVDGVRHHHERFGGGGYPDNLKGREISLFARILACADSFDAMTSMRPYRFKKLSVPEAILEIEKNIDIQFDPKVAHQFIRILKQNNT